MYYFFYRLFNGPIIKFKRHWFDIKFNTLEQYNNFVESRLCKFMHWLGLYRYNWDSPIGCTVWLTSSKDFNEVELDRLGSDSLKKAALKYKLHRLQKVHTLGEEGILIGVEVTHEDFYYILMTDKGKLWYPPVNAKICFIKNEK